MPSKLQARYVPLNVKLATGGGGVTVTIWVSASMPPASETERMTRYVPAAAYVCDAELPLPFAVPSPQLQPYVAEGWALEPLPSKLHARFEQVGAKLATGAGGGGGACVSRRNLIGIVGRLGPTQMSAYPSRSAPT